MKAGLCTRTGRGIIDYKGLRGLNAETARMFGITSAVVYDTLKKEKDCDLRDRPRVPKRQLRRTLAEIEERVVGVKNKVRLGPERLSLYLQEHEGLLVPLGSIRHILRRNKGRLEHGLQRRRTLKEKREFVDWYSAKLFEIVQMDVKHIRDQGANHPS